MPSIDVGIEEVAAAAGVATSTVSRALRNQQGVSEATRQRIRALAAELGYVPTSAAARLASGRTHTIGVLVPTMNRWFFSSVLEGIDEVLHAAGYDLMVFSLTGRGSERQRLFDRALRGRKLDGLIVLGFPLSRPEEARLRDAGVPVVAVGHSVPGVTSVSIDDRSVMETAVDHLHRLGHRDIGFLAGGMEFDLSFAVPRMREEGFHEALRTRGLMLRPEFRGRAAFTVESAYAAGRHLVERWAITPRPTAMVACSDEMAFGLIAAFREAGLRVPEDLSVMGVDDHDFSESFGLTTVAQDAVGHGRMAARLALSPERRRLAPSEPVPHELRVRRSTAAPRQRA